MSRARRIVYFCGATAGIIGLWIIASTAMLLYGATPVMDHYVDKFSIPLQSVALRPVPDILKDALVATEDRNFYSHHGVDWEAERRSANEDIRSLSFGHGGSTITMQAVRYTMLPYIKSPARKIAQIILAQQLDSRLTKQQILRLYVDSVSFGLHTAGLQRAAKTYFDERPENLNLAETAFLVGVISHPPATHEQVTQQFVRDRMEPVLAHIEQLYGDKYSAEQLDRAREEDLHFSWERVAGNRKTAGRK